MDYSKLTPEQLLELLKTQSPEMYGALTEPMYGPGEFYEGENPMADYLSHRDDLKNTIGRGYDPNLIVEDARNNQLFEPSLNNEILYQLMATSPSPEDYPGRFPSDSIDGSTIEKYKYLPPAAESANFFNQFTDEQLLNSLRPISDVDPMELLEDYESGTDSVDRILKRNKNFRWD